MRRLLLALAVLLIPLALACGGSSTTTSRPATDAVPTSPPTESVVLASGTIALAAASSFDDPGFHQALIVSATAPDLGPRPGRDLVLTLRDASRPEQACSQQHPLSGCATVDWSDGPSRPNVPANGVFDNHLVVVKCERPATNDVV